MASAISDEIEALAWLNLYIMASVSFSFYFSFGKASSELSSFAPTYSTKSWNTSPKVFKHSHQISTLFALL